MSGADWSRSEVEAIVDDYLSMLASEFAGTPYSKASHRKALLPVLADRSEQSVEYKHANISAALLALGFPYINGYKPRQNYQRMLEDVVAAKLQQSPHLLDLAGADADRPMVVPEVDDILKVLVQRPQPPGDSKSVSDSDIPRPSLGTNYLERESRNRSLGAAGERFILNYETARLVDAGKEVLASKIEHTSVMRGDYEGYDILSFEENGAERLIEVKTTKYGSETPFFASRNEVATSFGRSAQYYVYRLFSFRDDPRLFTLAGAIEATCRLAPTTFLAIPK